MNILFVRQPNLRARQLPSIVSICDRAATSSDDNNGSHGLTVLATAPSDPTRFGPSRDATTAAAAAFTLVHLLPSQQLQ